MRNRNEIISILNYAWDMLPKENEVTDDLNEVILQLEDEWINELSDDDEIM